MIAPGSLFPGTLLGGIRRWTSELLREAYRPAAFRKGVLVGLLSAVPFIAGMLAKEPLLAIFGSLAAVRLGMADPGGAYAHRFRTMLAGLVLVSTGTFLGTTLADGPLYYLPAVFMLVFAFAYLAALGSEGVAVSIVTLFLLVVSLGVPGDPLERAAGVFLAGAYMMAALLARWPFHPNAPAKSAMAQALNAVAALAERLSSPGSDQPEADERDLWACRTLAYRQLDNALQILAEDLPRLATGGAQHKSMQQLTAAAAAARRMTRALTLLAARRPDLSPALLAEIRAEAAMLRYAARRLPGLSLRRTAGSGLDLDLPDPAMDDGRMPALPTHLQGVHADLRSAALDLRQALRREKGEPAILPGAELLPEPGRIGRLFPWAWPRLRGSFTYQSTAFRHALRLSLLIGVATALVWHFQISFGYWVMLTIVMVTKPAYGGTRNAVGARMLGTIIGAGLAEIVLLGTPGFWVLAVLALVLNCLSHAFITTHYALGVSLLTPYVIFKIDAAMPDTDVTIPRLAATLIGGALIVASLLLWAPARYRSYWSSVGSTLTCLGKVVETLAAAAAAGGPPPPVNRPDLAIAQRGARMELLNAEAVLNEIFLEPAHWHPNRRELRSVVADLQRLTWTMNSLSAPRHDTPPVAGHLAAAAALMVEIAACCKALDRPRDNTDAGAWPADLAERVRLAMAPLDAMPDEALRRFAAALRDLAEDLASLHRLRLETAADAMILETKGGRT